MFLSQGAMQEMPPAYPGKTTSPLVVMHAPHLTGKGQNNLNEDPAHTTATVYVHEPVAK